ncbi:RDD family protein [Hyphomicrobium sp.]|uniref:RDD family protein n=1 Tax=Hyphomicrobium sp. TaxID=82 RepID=UPI002E2FF583|nr:RDD family protein [Hyphomicrobium sp.]HEX2843253.1 RDD family protein [Hyphomicrobium sp.]
MATIEAPADSTTTIYAGFWKRALALLIDVCLINTVVSLVFLGLALAIPGLGKVITLDTPFGIGTVERTIEDKSTETPAADGTKHTTTDKLIERTVLDRWVYRYHIVGTGRETDNDYYSAKLRTYGSQQLDPATGQEIETTNVDSIALVVLMLYWILADASRYRGSLGKRVLGLSVVDGQGERLMLADAAGRNLLKILSAMPALIGFMMAGWTKRKQALHDKLVGAYVASKG